MTRIYDAKHQFMFAKQTIHFPRPLALCPWPSHSAFKRALPFFGTGDIMGIDRFKEEI